MSGTVIVGATVIHSDGLGADSVALDADRITAVGPGIETPRRGWTVIHAEGLYLMPGLIDIHTHGAHGYTFNQADPVSWCAAADAHTAAGTTSVLATLASDTISALCRAIDAGRRCGHPAVIGSHLEGPYLNPAQRGAHPAAALRSPSDRSWPQLLDATGFLRLMTLAPELSGSAELISALLSAGVVIAAGHSTATAEHLSGVTHIAHLWSGQSSVSHTASGRVPGLLETALASDPPITAELIADGHHLPAELVRIAYRCLGPDRCVLVSDSCSGTGLPVGSAFTMGACTGLVADGVAVTERGDSLCGSTSFLLDIVRFAVQRAGLPVVDAIRMATATPARILGMHNDIGVITPGAKADILLTDHELRIRAVMSAGRWITSEGINGAD